MPDIPPTHGDIEDLERVATDANKSVYVNSKRLFKLTRVDWGSAGQTKRNRSLLLELAHDSSGRGWAAILAGAAKVQLPRLRPWVAVPVPYEIRPAFETLNEGQKRAVCAALELVRQGGSELTGDRWALPVCGYPGTGKSSMLAVLLLGLRYGSERRVLLVSHTHTAVDNLLLKAKELAGKNNLKDFDFVRLGRSSSTSVKPELAEHYPPSGWPSVESISDFLRTRGGRLVACTALACHNALLWPPKPPNEEDVPTQPPRVNSSQPKILDKGLPQPPDFDIVLVDEAGQDSRENELSDSCPLRDALRSMLWAYRYGDGDAGSRHLLSESHDLYEGSIVGSVILSRRGNRSAALLIENGVRQLSGHRDCGGVIQGMSARRCQQMFGCWTVQKGKRCSLFIVNIVLLWCSLKLATRGAILVGDQYQLPPVVKDRKCRDEGMSETLFARCARDMASIELTAQYRMCRGIQRFVNELFYEGKLKCGSREVEDAKMPRVFTTALAGPWIEEMWNPEQPVVMIDVSQWRSAANEKFIAAADEKEDGRVYSRAEAQVIKSFVTTVPRHSLASEDMVILSPYVKQVKLIQGLLAAGDRSDVEVMTVDRSQGRDWKVVVISLVRSRSLDNERGGDASSDVLVPPPVYNVNWTRIHELLQNSDALVKEAVSPLEAPADLWTNGRHVLDGTLHFMLVVATWELLAYDGPSTIDVEFLNGDKRRFMADHFSDGEMNSIVENWKFQVAYNSFKQNRDKRYIIFRVNDCDQVVVASEGDRDKTYEDFTKAINDEKEPAYGVVDFKPEGSEEDKTVLFVWAPDTSSMKKRDDMTLDKVLAHYA
ncbi:Tripartite DNA replication factor [Perkinsus olseni]|uniref:Tripartite DNA replication factor n=1 Tax=Perkinsus olseni TaxID=32597 RepID=A0A7J6P1L2_PEROL|nr:Tripartite DNA replication factor [Perkinsus olseni]